MAQIVKQVGETSEIEIQFKLSLLDGTVVDQTEEDEVFAFQIGDGQLLNKLDELLIGLEEGTTGKFSLMPQDAFGEKDEANFQSMQRSEFPEEMVLEEGHVIGFDTPTGDQIPGVIHEVSEETVIIDFNHPLSGQPVVFEAKIISILS